MKKLVLLVASAVFALSFGIAHAVDAPKAPEKVTNYGKKDVVTFDHAKHKDAKCDKCHHNAKEGKFKCGECHGKDDNAKTKAPKLETVAHGKDVGVCYGCHRAEDAKNKFKCNQCHKK